MRIWVLENGLRDKAGHHFNNSLGLQQACAARGIETRFLVHRAAWPDVVQALQARAVFAFTPYEEVCDDPLAGPLESLMVQARAFAEAWSIALEQGLSADDLVWVPTTLQHELLGCSLALSSMQPARRPRLLLNFGVENFLAPGTLVLGPHAGLYRFAMRELQRVQPPERRLLTVNGARMALHLSGVLAHPVQEYPMPKHYPPPQPATPGTANAAPLVAVLGHWRVEKGFALVPSLVLRHPQLRFLIHISTETQRRQWQAAGPALQAAAHAEVVLGALDAQAYHALMARADILLLPYDAALLPLRTSGVFSEAVAAAKVLVVPAGTWMEEHLAQGHGAGVAFGQRSPAALSEALQAALQRLPQLRAHAQAAAPQWRATQCIEAYLERALRHFNLASA